MVPGRVSQAGTPASPVLPLLEPLLLVVPLLLPLLLPPLLLAPESFTGGDVVLLSSPEHAYRSVSPSADATRALVQVAKPINLRFMPSSIRALAEGRADGFDRTSPKAPGCGVTEAREAETVLLPQDERSLGTAFES